MKYIVENWFVIVGLIAVCAAGGYSCCRRKEDGQNNRRPLPLRRIRACTVRAVIKNKDIKKRTTSISGCRPCVIMNL